MKEIAFSGKRRYLSNMYICSITTTTDMKFNISLPDAIWVSSEHIYHFFKSDDKKYLRCHITALKGTMV